MTLVLDEPTGKGPKPSIMVVSDDSAIGEAVKQVLTPGDDIRVDLEKTTLSGLNGRTAEVLEKHGLVVFRLHADTDRAAVEELRAKHGRSGTLLALSDEPISLADARSLKKVGIDEILPFPLPPADLRDALLELSGRNAQLPAIIDRATRPGEVIAVCPVRGGIGASTVAINLADQLQGATGRRRKTAKHRVALVDLDLQFGTVASALDLDPSDMFYRLGSSDIVPDRTFIAQSLQSHSSGLSVLTAPDKFMPLDAVGTGQIDAVIGQLQREFDYVVVDLPRTLVEWVGPVVSRCARLMMVSDMTVPSIRQARRLIDFYSEDRFDLPVEMVLNHEKKPMIQASLHKEAVKVLDRPLKHWLPDDPKHSRVALDRGVLLSDVSGGALAAAIKKMAKSIQDETTQPSATRPTSA